MVITNSLTPKREDFGVLVGSHVFQGEWRGYQLSLTEFKGNNVTSQTKFKECIVVPIPGELVPDKSSFSNYEIER